MKLIQIDDAYQLKYSRTKKLHRLFEFKSKLPDKEYHEIIHQIDKAFELVNEKEILKARRFTLNLIKKHKYDALQAYPIIYLIYTDENTISKYLAPCCKFIVDEVKRVNYISPDRLYEHNRNGLAALEILFLMGRIEIRSKDIKLQQMGIRKFELILNLQPTDPFNVRSYLAWHLIRMGHLTPVVNLRNSYLKIPMGIKDYELDYAAGLATLLKGDLSGARIYFERTDGLLGHLMVSCWWQLDKYLTCDNPRWNHNRLKFSTGIDKALEIYARSNDLWLPILQQKPEFGNLNYFLMMSFPFDLYHSRRSPIGLNEKSSEKKEVIKARTEYSVDDDMRDTFKYLADFVLIPIDFSKADVVSDPTIKVIELQNLQSRIKSEEERS